MINVFMAKICYIYQSNGNNREKHEINYQISYVIIIKHLVSMTRISVLVVYRHEFWFTISNISENF